MSHGLFWPSTGVLFGDSEVKSGALPEFGFHPDSSAALFYDAFRDRQANPGAGELVPVQALEHSKNLLVIPWLDADAIVSNGELDRVIGIEGRDMNPRRFRPAERDRVGQQLAKKLRQLGEIEENFG